MTRPGNAPNPLPDDALALPLVPVGPAHPVLVVSDDDVRFTRGPRSYRVRGLARNLSAESLKVTLRVSAGEHLHVDTLDLYQARARGSFVKAVSLELGTTESVIAGDVAALMLALEPLQEAAIRGALQPETTEAPPLSEADAAAWPRAIARSVAR